MQIGRGGNADDKTSTSTYVAFFGGNPIFWLSRKQCIVALLSTKVEYRAIATIIAKVMWLHNILSKLQVPLNFPLIILSSNVSATYLS